MNRKLPVFYSFLYLVCGCVSGRAVQDGPGVSCQWMIDEDKVETLDSAWIYGHTLPSTDGKGGSVKVLDKNGHQDSRMSCFLSGNRPAVSGMRDGDCLLFSIPADNMAGATYVEFDATFGGDACSPERFRVEYLDGGEWKWSGVSFRTSGDISTGPGEADSYQYTTCLATMLFEHPFENDTLKIRCTAESDKTDDGSILHGEGVTILADFGFVAAEVKALGHQEPDDTLRVLMLGNSFTYFYGSPFMLKEIAWHEGLFLDIRANLKGGQTLGDHLSLSLSEDAIKDGRYDYAIIQDQSQNAARYSKDPEKYQDVSDNFNKMVSEIMEYSPGCRIILDRTWAYEGVNCGGFGDLVAFDMMLAEGSHRLAEEKQGTLVAPVGEAFAECRNRYPDIELYFEDRKHPSAEGAYLKACVEYIVLTGADFGNNPADCGIQEDIASRLRDVAEKVAE